jgi:hypothetical protein
MYREVSSCAIGEKKGLYATTCQTAHSKPHLAGTFRKEYLSQNCGVKVLHAEVLLAAGFVLLVQGVGVLLVQLLG